MIVCRQRLSFVHALLGACPPQGIVRHRSPQGCAFFLPSVERFLVGFELSAVRLVHTREHGAITDYLHQP